MMIYKTSASSPHIKPELLMFTPSCCSPSDVKNVSVMTAMSGGLQESQLGVWDIPRLIQQLCPKSRVEQCVCVSLLYWVIWLCLLLFSLLHACHSCCLAMQRAQMLSIHPAYHCICVAFLWSDYLSMTVSVCFIVPCILRSSVITRPPVVMGAPSKQSGMSSVSRLWHGLTHVRSGHHDGLHGCQWKPGWAVSGLDRGGSRDLHDCVQEPLGSGKHWHGNISPNAWFNISDKNTQICKQWSTKNPTWTIKDKNH